MNFRSILTLTIFLTALTLCSAKSSAPADAGKYDLKGKTYSEATGKKETLDDMILHVTSGSSGNSIFMENFQMLGKKNISITGTLHTDANGRITSYDDMNVKGVPAVNIKSISGTLTDSKADITMEGKALFIGFKIHYTGSK